MLQTNKCKKLGALVGERLATDHNYLNNSNGHNCVGNSNGLPTKKFCLTKHKKEDFKFRKRKQLKLILFFFSNLRHNKKKFSLTN